MYKPWGICVDCHGDIYITDEGNHRIQKFTPGRKFERMLLSKVDDLETPADIYVTETEHLVTVTEKEIVYIVKTDESCLRHSCYGDLFI